MADALEESLDEKTAPILGPNKNPREKAIPTSACKHKKKLLNVVTYFFKFTLFYFYNHC